MMDLLKTKKIGFYFTALAGIFAIATVIYYYIWAQSHNALNPVVLVVLLIGFLLDVVLVYYDNDFLTIGATICYSIALFQLVVDSVGSLVDFFQGIVMFGDSTQVGTIFTLSCMILVGTIASIIASFMERVKVKSIM